MAGRRHRGIWLGAAVAVVLLACGALASGAFADTWCVHKVDVSECPSGSNLTRGDDLNAAISDADDTDDPDTIFIAPGTYDAADHGSPFSGGLAHPLTIVGAGRDRTTLTDSTASAPWVLDLTGANDDLD